MLRMPLSVKSRLRKRPGRVLPTLLPGGIVYCGWLKVFKVSHRNSSRLRSPAANDLNRLRAKLFMPSVTCVFHPTVEALGGPRPSIQYTSDGETHVLVSGFR